MSAENPQDHRLDHVVVLMFENRSFDNLLGYLYEPGDVKAFEGVRGRTLANPVPPTVPDAGAGVVSVHPSTSMASPYPDPGEEYPHVNTQLFGTVDPDSNRLAEVRDMRPPFNFPTLSVPSEPAMNGFVADYANAFQVQMDRPPNVAEYSQITACYTPDQVPVLSALARGFACFDHWFCEVPSQTYPNRSFFHAATSSGFVLNGDPPGKFALKNDARTVFEQLEAAHRTWRVYIDPAQILPATGLIHARRLAKYFASNFQTILDFYDDARKGELPSYSFIEPNMFHPHTDMHPHSGARWAEDLHLRPPDTLLGGEQLLADVYNAIRTSPVEGGSNWANTMLLVTFDEHGGTYDHVPPPAALPPSPQDSPGEQGFGFNRLGVRIPTIAVSAWTDERTVVVDRFQSTSLIRTLRDWWDLDAPLTQRDAHAPSLLPVLSRRKPRPPEEWPAVTPRKPGLLERAESDFLRLVEAFESPMERLERDLLGDALAHEADATGKMVAPDMGQVSHREAHEHFRRVSSNLFPGIAGGRRG
jgi:phospholipase C